eukprot:scaffold85808_cov29-Tisochrysis_lutea.AAC.2
MAVSPEGHRPRAETAFPRLQAAHAPCVLAPSDACSAFCGQSGANANSLDKSGSSALSISAALSHNEILGLLLAAGKSPSSLAMLRHGDATLCHGDASRLRRL